MIGDLKLSDLISKDLWDKTKIPQRVVNCNTYGVNGRSASKAWEDLTIQEALLLNGKLRYPLGTGDPFMTSAEFARARQNREGYTPKYPDGREETDESKERRRAKRRAEQPVRVAQVKKMPVWDSVNMRMVYQ